MAKTNEKLQELIIYICNRSDGDPRFGAVKLNKILFFSDVAAYLRDGHTLTEHTYVKQPHGPCPTGIDRILKAMQRNGALYMVERVHFGLPQHRFVAARPADLSRFTGEEIATVDEVLDECRPLSGKDISELSHRKLGWQAARTGETIPFESLRVTKSEPSAQLTQEALKVSQAAKEFLAA
jgi:hypothetical protein